MANNYVVKDGVGASLTKAATDVGSGVEADRVQVCDATAANFLPTGDAAARSIFVQCTDGTTGPVAVKAASTGAAATDKALVVRPMMGTNGTQTMPTGDAVARTVFVTPNDGTNAVTVKAASTAALATDTGLVVRPLMGTDGTNTMPTADAAGRALFAEITDGTNTATVKAASTGAALTDKALVVVKSPNCGLTKGGAADLAGTVTAIKTSAGTLNTLTIVNAQAALIAFIQLFDVAAGSVILATTVPDLQIAVPAQTTVHIPFPDGLPFGTAISVASTTTVKGLTGSAAGVNVYWSRA